jgi:hypothetical protein
LEISWTDGEITTVVVSKWVVEEVRQWALLSVGVAPEEAAKVHLDGAALLRMPLYPPTRLEEALVGGGVSGEAAEAIATAYMEQRWKITTEVRLLV